MKNLRKALLLLIFAFIIILMLLTGVYALVSIILSLCADGSILHIFGLLFSGIISGFICYLLHKITF